MFTGDAIGVAVFGEIKLAAGVHENVYPGVPPEAFPIRLTELFLQTKVSFPAFAIGKGLTIISNESLLKQLPEPIE